MSYIKISEKKTALNSNDCVECVNEVIFDKMIQALLILSLKGGQQEDCKVKFLIILTRLTVSSGS